MRTKQPVAFSELLARTRGDSLIGLLPVLEHSHLEAQAFESAGLLRLPELVVFALKEGSAYWAGLALNWLEAGFPFSECIKTELLFASQRPELDQATRHRLYALHRKKA